MTVGEQFAVAALSFIIAFIAWIGVFKWGFETGWLRALGIAILATALFIVLGIYFTGFWSRSGQTLAMKTWHIRLQARDGGVPSQARAFVRYVASWLWFVPALASAHFSGIHSTLAFAVIVAAGMLAYALLARLRGDRQFLHDALCGTQLVDSREIQPAPAQSVS